MNKGLAATGLQAALPEGRIDSRRRNDHKSALIHVRRIVSPLPDSHLIASTAYSEAINSTVGERTPTVSQVADPSSSSDSPIKHRKHAVRPRMSAALIPWDHRIGMECAAESIHRLIANEQPHYPYRQARGSPL